MVTEQTVCWGVGCTVIEQKRNVFGNRKERHKEEWDAGPIDGSCVLVQLLSTAAHSDIVMVPPCCEHSECFDVYPWLAGGIPGHRKQMSQSASSGGKTQVRGTIWRQINCLINQRNQEVFDICMSTKSRRVKNTAKRAPWSGANGFLLALPQGDSDSERSSNSRSQDVFRSVSASQKVSGGAC